MGRPFLPDRYQFVILDGLTENAHVDAAEEEKRGGLTIHRVRLPTDENARIWS